jgi:hypothetical protein
MQEVVPNVKIVAPKKSVLSPSENEIVLQCLACGRTLSGVTSVTYVSLIPLFASSFSAFHIASVLTVTRGPI